VGETEVRDVLVELEMQWNSQGLKSLNAQLIDVHLIAFLPYAIVYFQLFQLPPASDHLQIWQREAVDFEHSESFAEGRG